MRNLRYWIDVVEGVVSFAAHQREPEDMMPDVPVGRYVIHAARKYPESPRKLAYWVTIEGPDRDPDEQFDIRRYARGPEPEQVLGLPDMSGGPEQSTRVFVDFAKRAETLDKVYGVEKPPEVRNNPAWVTWRREAIMRMAKQFGLGES